MILTDQPKCFDKSVVSAVSSKADGQMQLGWREPISEVERNRRLFLSKSNLGTKSAVLVKVKYQEAMTYDKIMKVEEVVHNDVDALAEIPADCLITDQKGITMLLPVADCIATIVHDPVRSVIALAHLGRHSTVAKLASKLADYFHQEYGSDAKDLIVWMSPSIKKESYILGTADFIDKDNSWDGFYSTKSGRFAIDMQGYNSAQFETSGVMAKNIHVSQVDTAKSDDYWSHYQATTIEKSEAPPRFAVYCSLV